MLLLLPMLGSSRRGSGQFCSVCLGLPLTAQLLAPLAGAPGTCDMYLGGLGGTTKAGYLRQLPTDVFRQHSSQNSVLQVPCQICKSFIQTGTNDSLNSSSFFKGGENLMSGREKKIRGSKGVLKGATEIKGRGRERGTSIMNREKGIRGR